jgi:flagellar biogenesis protein FliO
MLLQKKTRSANFNIVSILIKLSIVILIILGAVYLLNKIDFPSPKKTIEKIIPNENFKIVK